MEDQVIKRALAKLDIAIQKKFKEVKNYTSRRDQDKNYSFELDIGMAAHITGMIRTGNKMMVLRSESSPDGMSQQELEELGNEIIEKVSAKWTAYDGVLAIMKADSFAKMEDEDAEKLIFNEVMSFVQNLLLYQRRLQGQAGGEDESGYYTGDGEDQENDPFGFNSIILDEEGNVVSTDGDGSEPPTDEETEDTGKEEMAEEAPAGQTQDAGYVPPVKSEEPDIEEALAAFEEEHEDERRLNDMLSELDQEEPLEIEPVDIKDFVPTPAVVDVAEQEVPENVDVLTTLDAYHGNDQFGLVQKTRQYKDEAQKAIDQIHDILAKLYSPVYQMSIELYTRNDKLLVNEKNVQQTLDKLSARQRQIDMEESQILEQQQALLRDRANFNQYRESIRGILNDYDIKCRIVNEQADELRILRYNLSAQTGKAEQLQRQLDALMSDDASKKVNQGYAEAILRANEKLQEQIRMLQERLNKYYKIIDAFKDCQKNWAKREAEYKRLIRDLGDSTTLSDIAKEEIANAQERIAELEVAVAQQTRIAEEQSQEAEEQRARADAAVSKGKKLQSKLHENEEEKDELAKRAEKAESELANAQLKSDITHNAINIREQLEEIGIKVDAVPGESEMIFTADSNGCEIVINVGLAIIYINKAVKKPQKYSKQIETLNKQDIRTSYTVTEKEITCRTMYTNIEEVAVQVEGILTEMNSFK